MNRLARINHFALALFAAASGTFKLVGGRADVELFARMGMTPLIVAAFGAVQLAAGVLLLRRATRRRAAVVVLACNALATAGLFVAGIQPFGVISLVFVAMALAEALDAPPAGRLTSA